MLRHSLRIALLVAIATTTRIHTSLAADAVDDARAAIGSDTSGQTTGDVGWIKRNATPEKVDAPFALVDRRGTVRYYLEPSDGVDLAKFVNQQVSVRGQVTALPEQQGRLLTVEDLGPPSVSKNRGPQKSPVRAAPARERFPATQAGYQQRQPTPAMPEELPSERTSATPDAIADGDGHPSAALGGPVEGDFEDCYDDCDEDCVDGPCANFCGPPGFFWVRAEYLQWWTKGMALPPLVTTGPSAEQPGFIGSPGTVILFGNDRVNDFGRSGGRITAGTWLNSCQTFGIQGDYFGLASATTDYSATSGGNPILSRPFFDTRPSLADQNVQLVASPDVIAGTVRVHVPTEFQSAGLGALFNLCCSCNCDPCACGPCFEGPSWWRLDFLVGYRYAELSDQVTVNENLVSLLPDLQGTFIVDDRFTSKNRFNGVELGIIAQSFKGRWLFEGIYKLAIGNTNQFVTINGSTVTTQGGTTTTDVGGLLALPSNIGNYRRDVFAMMPQLGANIGYQITPHVRAIVGYTFFYWSRVARAGEQIDFEVNSSQLPNSPIPPEGDLNHPKFVWRDTDFWAQGVNVGLDFRW